MILNVGDNDFCYHSLDNINIYRSRLRLFLRRSVYRRVFFLPDFKTVVLRFAKRNTWVPWKTLTSQETPRKHLWSLDNVDKSYFFIQASAAISICSTFVNRHCGHLRVAEIVKLAWWCNRYTRCVRINAKVYRSEIFGAHIHKKTL